MPERRRHPRIEKILPLKMSDPEFDILTETKNISGCGAYCAVDKPLPLMTKLNIVLLVPVKKSKGKVIKKINCQGVVVRREYLKDNGRHIYYVGVYFNQINDRDKKLLISCINSLLHQESVSIHPRD